MQYYLTYINTCLFKFFLANQTKAALQHFLNKDSALSEWVCQQQSTASGDSRQLAAMVMGISSPSSSSLLTSLSDNLTASQKLPSDPSLLRGFENERTKGNSLLRKVWNVFMYPLYIFLISSHVFALAEPLTLTYWSLGKTCFFITYI